MSRPTRTNDGVFPPHLGSNTPAGSKRRGTSGDCLVPELKGHRPSMVRMREVTARASRPLILREDWKPAHDNTDPAPFASAHPVSRRQEDVRRSLPLVNRTGPIGKISPA